MRSAPSRLLRKLLMLTLLTVLATVMLAAPAPTVMAALATT